MLTQHHTGVGGSDCACAAEMLIQAPQAVDGEDDCACADELLIGFSQPAEHEDNCACAPVAGDALTRLHAAVSDWRMAPEVLVCPLTEERFLLVNPARGGRMVILERGEFALLQGTQEAASDCAPPGATALSPQSAQALQQLGLLTPAESHCACAATDAPCRQRRAVPTALTAWLHLTDRCNLRCDYCYLPHKREDISPATGRAAVDATFRSAAANGLREVKLKYAGGEPLLRFPFLVDLHRYAQARADEAGIALQGVVLSNGTLLTADIAETMHALGLRLMISLDGLGRYHDAHRRYAGGRGTFADVAEAVDLALAHGLTPSISVTVSGRTADGLPEVMAWILARDLPFSLNFYRENPFSASHADLRLDEEEIIAGMLAAFKVIEANLPRQPFLGGLVDRANLSMGHIHTCGVGQNYLVFDPHGRLAKCQMQMHAPVGEAGMQDPLAVVRADRRGVQNVSVEEKEGCRECQWRYWCAGGCPLETFRVTGRYDVQSPNCNIYRALFPAALRLEGLRLLKYQDDPEVVEKIVL